MRNRIQDVPRRLRLLLFSLLCLQQQGQQTVAASFLSIASSSSLLARTTKVRASHPLHSTPIEFGKPGQCLVYLVDDEESIRTAVGRFLANRQYHVMSFADAPSCLDQLTNVAAATSSMQQQPYGWSLPKVLISDIRMPGMDGLELLHAIRNDNALVDLPVILLTAKGRTPDRIQGYNAGADAYIPKPFDPDELVSVMEQVMKTHETLAPTNDAATDIQNLKRDLQDIKALLLEEGGGGAGLNGFVNNKDAMNDERVFLTPDERAILTYLCDGLMNKEIAANMSLSKPRVASLLTQMFRKAKVKNRTELARWAITNGLIQV